MLEVVNCFFLCVLLFTGIIGNEGTEILLVFMKMSVCLVVINGL